MHFALSTASPCIYEAFFNILISDIFKQIINHKKDMMRHYLTIENHNEH